MLINRPPASALLLALASIFSLSMQGKSRRAQSRLRLLPTTFKLSRYYRDCEAERKNFFLDPSHLEPHDSRSPVAYISVGADLCRSNAPRNTRKCARQRNPIAGTAVSLNNPQLKSLCPVRARDELEIVINPKTGSKLSVPQSEPQFLVARRRIVLRERRMRDARAFLATET